MQGPFAQLWINALSLQTMLKKSREKQSSFYYEIEDVSQLQQQNNAITTVKRLTIFIANAYIYRGNR